MPQFFHQLERDAWGGFVSTQARVFRAIEDDLRRFGISHAEFEVLLRLYQSAEGRLRLQDLSARSLLSPSGTSRLVDRLVRAGHVQREGAPEDARGAYAVLTASGRSHFEAAAAAHVEVVRREFLAHLDETEQGLIAALWRRMAGPA
jgi:DNA-binding MarR family transcriptional regulator